MEIQMKIKNIDDIKKRLGYASESTKVTPHSARKSLSRIMERN